MGRDSTMAKVIEFYVPDSFRTQTSQFAVEHRAKVIEFCPKEADGGDSDYCKSVQEAAAVVPFPNW